MINEADVVKFYQYFYSKKYKNPKYKFIPSDKSKKTIEKFLSFFDQKYKLQTLGNQFLWNYFVYQFKYWDEVEIQSFSEKIQPNYILGQKAVIRYIERDIEYDYLFERCNFIEIHGLKKSDVIQLEKQLYDDSHETMLKSRFHNTINGFDLCITMTTMYNHRQMVCITCQFKNDCKKILKDNFPKIYEKRGYNKTGEN